MSTDRQARERARQVIAAVLRAMIKVRDPFLGDPGHGAGHWCRDYVHSLFIAQDPEIDAGAKFIGIVGGTLHDAGTMFFDRYADRDRSVRHAELGALLVRAAVLEAELATPPEADLIAWSIAAHTHYQKSATVECQDGQKRDVAPFLDVHEGAPILPIWLPRWADRLDCSGPCMVGRHFLTLARDHYDFSSDNGFYLVSFADHLRVLRRTPEEIRAQGGRQTMVEHLLMFAGSQANTSVYGRYDRGLFVQLRDRYRSSLEYIVDQVLHSTDVQEDRVLHAWTEFLGFNLEPTELGRSAAHDLGLAFAGLPADVRRAWANGFRTTMTEYLSHAERLLAFLNRLPAADLKIPGVFTDVRTVLRPDLRWVSTLTNM